MSNIPYSTITRTFDKINLIKMEKIGGGKTAVVYAGKTHGGHRRAVRIFKFGEDDDNFTFEDYVNVKKDIQDKYSYIYKVMKDHIPRLYDIYLITSKQNDTRVLALAQVTALIYGPTISELTDMTSIMISNLRSLFSKLWSNRISHGDLFRGNIIYNKKHNKWMLLDLDNIKIHKSSRLARERDMGLMDPILFSQVFDPLS